MAHLMRSLRPAAVNRPVLGLTPTLAALTATLMLGACAQTTDLLPKSNLTVASDEADKASSMPQNELQKATTYWGQEYAKKPAELKPALNYARNLKALGEKGKALAVLQRAASLHDDDPELASEYGRLALELDQIGVAARMLELADDPAKPDWKIISARGTVFAKQGQYKQAIPFYERALTLAQNQPSVLNNLAMAYAMGGDPKKAEDLLRQASARPDINAEKVHQNLALVLGLQGRYAEAKAVSAGSASAEMTAENVDVMRRIVKLEPKDAAATAVAAVPDFKTQVSRAVANDPAAAEPAAFQTTTSVAPRLKAAASDTSATATTVWQTKVASDLSSAPATGLKGSAP